jgi:hypothetical protein
MNILNDKIAKIMGFEIRKHRYGRYGNGFIYGWKKRNRMFVPGIKTLLGELVDLLMTGVMLLVCLGWTTIELFKRALNKDSF